MLLYPLTRKSIRSRVRQITEALVLIGGVLVCVGNFFFRSVLLLNINFTIMSTTLLIYKVLGVLDEAVSDYYNVKIIGLVSNQSPIRRSEKNPLVLQLRSLKNLCVEPNQICELRTGMKLKDSVIVMNVSPRYKHIQLERYYFNDEDQLVVEVKNVTNDVASVSENDYFLEFVFLKPENSNIWFEST